MKATDILMQEHDLILRGVSILGYMSQRALAGEPVPASDVRAMIEFIREFADSRHHAKEEGVLFPAMEAAGIAREGGPIGWMLTEHDQGRAAVRAMDEAVARFDTDASALAAFGRAAHVYAHLLAHHICKENHVLFRMANDVIPAAHDAVMVAAYEAQERAIGAEDTASFVPIIEGLEVTYCAPPVERVHAPSAAASVTG